MAALKLNPGPVASQFIKAVATGAGDEILALGPRGEAKALRNDELVLTPFGWQEIKELKINDNVFTQDGEKTRVTGVFPQGELDLHELFFSDKSSLICSLDHLWAVITCWDRRTRIRRRNKLGVPETPRTYRRSQSWTIKNTEIIKARLDSGAWKCGGRWAIPLTKAIKFPEKVVPLDPWLMGALLGDGGFTTGTISFTSSDEFLVDKVRVKLPEPVQLKPRSLIDYQITMGNIGGFKNPVKEVLRILGLDNHYSYEKFVPDIYLWNAPWVRLKILQGLLDTDGTVLRHSNSVSFSTTSERLGKDVEFLVRSLGGITTRHKPKRAKYKGVEKRLAYKITISLPNGVEPFTLPRKLNLLQDKQNRGMARRFITGIKSVGRAEATCIKIEHPSGLFVAKDFIVTHNTQSAAIATVLHAKLHEEKKFILNDQNEKIPLTLPVPWICVTDTFNAHKEKTIPSLQQIMWQGAWRMEDGGHKAIFKTNKDAVVLSLFGIEDNTALDRARKETACSWFEEIAPTTEGAGLPEEAIDISITSQRLPTHAAVTLLTSNYPDDDHWLWKRFMPIIGKYGLNVHPEDPRKMTFQIPKGDNPYITEAQRRRWAERLKDRPDLMDRLLEGKPSIVHKGQAVAMAWINNQPIGFNEPKHVSSGRLAIAKNVPFILGQDGGHTPATTGLQEVNGVLRVQFSMCISRGGMRQQYLHNIIPWFRKFAPWVLDDPDEFVLGGYDPSLPDDESDTERVDKNPIDVIKNEVGGLWEPGPVDWEARKNAMFGSFNRAIGGDIGLQIDPIHAEGLIRALRGQWYYATDRFGGVQNDRPKSPNHPHDDYGQSFCYALCRVQSYLGDDEKEWSKNHLKDYDPLEERS